MLSLTIKDTKNFMSQLLIKEAFDGLFLSEAVIKTANSYTISGELNKDFFSEEEGGDRPSRGAGARYSLNVAFQEAVMGATKRITLPTGKSLDVKVPPGTKDGATLRLKGQGHPGRSDGPAGDALIEIEVVQELLDEAAAVKDML